MELSNGQGKFPLIDLTIRGLKLMRFWNESPGEPFSMIGLILVASYPIAWLIPSWLFIVSSQDNLTLLMKAANEQIVFMAIFFKLCVFAINFHRWEQLFYDLQRAYSSVMDDQSLDVQRILGHVQKSSYFLTKGYTSLLCFNCALYGVFPMLFVAVKYAITGSYDTPLSTPIEANYFIPGYRTHFWLWLPLNVMLNVLLEFHGIALFLIECFTWNLVHATSCLFRVLQIQAHELSNQSERKDQWCAKFERFVTTHDSVLRSARTLEEVLSFQMLFLYMSTVFALCLMVMVLSLAFKDVFLLIAMICVIGYCLFQTFSFSYLGTELIEASGSVTDAIFHSSWYNQNVKRQKDLCFVLMRAKRPVKLTAGQFFVVTRDSFTEMIKQAYTIFTLMSQFLEENDN
ncbi:odorant receptor 94b-like [Anopheles maculipalpis]|uniref:odorant receptor 94b-like n=1 Tax=Anopheles maculipalpis TaxID=1496333 RepID=UPI002158D830|nr:odorant receptor 94b-like [Anopheles maculipalpis]